MPTIVQQSKRILLDTDSRLRGYTALIPILHGHYPLSGDLNLLTAAEELARSCIDVCILANTCQPSLLRIQLACILLDNYCLTSELIRLSEAIELLKRCIPVSSLDDSTRIHAQIKLGQALFEQHRATEQIEDVRAAIALLEGVAQVSDAANKLQRCLALSLLAIYKSGGLVTRALKLSAEDIPSLEIKLVEFDPMTEEWDQRPVYLIARASLCFTQATTTKDLKHVHEGTQFSELVVRDYPPTHPSYIQGLFFMAKLALLRGRLSGDQSYIEKASCIAERAASGRIPISPVDRAYALYDWARCRIDVAHRNGELNELESALEVLQSALDVCPDPHWNRKVIIETMSWGFGTYFEQSGHVRALDKIIGLPQYSQETVYNYPFFATNVAEAMILRARTTAPTTSKHLLKEAVKIVEARMEIYLQLQRTAETWEKAELSTKVIQATLFLEEIDGALATKMDLGTMLQLARESLECTIPEQRTPATILLCQLLLRQGLALPDRAMVQEAECRLGECLADKTTNRIHCTELLAMEALALTIRSTLFQDDQFLDEVWRKYEEAVGDIGGRPRERFFAALKWANCAQEKGIQNMALTAYRHAIELLPRLAYLGHDIIGQLEILREVNGLASAAATVALSLGQVESAIEMLEQSRGIHWNRELQLRPPTDQLSEDVKEQLDQVCRSLNDEGLIAAGRREKAKELDVILRRIRSTKGTERFLLAPMIKDLNLITQDLQATLAVIIPGETGCYAILIGVSNDPKSIRLSITASRLEEMTKRISSLQSIVGVRRRDSRKVQFSALKSSQESIYTSYLNEILSELWVTVARPILGALKLEPIHNLRQRKRLIWCSVGLFNQLPLHAAGIYDKSGPREELANYVLCSYIPTLTALHRAWNRHMLPMEASSRGSPGASVLVIAQSQSATTNPLPMARTEAEVIKELLPPDQLIRDPIASSGMKIDEALQSLPGVEVLHLACHGHQDQDDVLNSGFELEDGRLTLGELMKMDISNAGLAYLSACETCGTDETRLDEGINLAATMLFVGFKSVIATMWAMDDVDGPFIAQRVYRSIYKSGKLDIEAVPWALDDAVRELRESGVPASRWATYVHIGV